jgi:hypothetical protein
MIVHNESFWSSQRARTHSALKGREDMKLRMEIIERSLIKLMDKTISRLRLSR